MSPFGQLLGLSLVIHVIVIASQITLNSVRLVLRTITGVRFLPIVLSLLILTASTTTILWLASVVLFKTSLPEYSNVPLVASIAETTISGASNALTRAHSFPRLAFAVTPIVLAAIATALQQNLRRKTVW